MQQNPLYSVDPRFQSSLPNPAELNKMVYDYLGNASRQITGQLPYQPPPSTTAVPTQQETPTFHCQPVKNVEEVAQLKWFNSTPFIGLIEDGQYIVVKRWDSTIPAASLDYFKKISPDELPKPPKAVTQEELMSILPGVLEQYIPAILNQMGVKTHESTANSTGSASSVIQLPATATRPKGDVGSGPSETVRDQ